MLTQLSFRTKITVLAAVGVFLAALLSLAGYMGISKLNHAVSEQAEAASLLRSGLMGDMMHDAVNSDVLSALLTGGKPEIDPKAKEDVLASIQDHDKTFRQQMENLSLGKFGPDEQAQLDQAKADVTEYLRVADSIIKLAFQDHYAAEQQMPVFEKQFRALEVSLEKLGDTLENKIKDIETRGTATGWLAYRLLFLATLFGLAMLGIVSFLITRSLLKEMGGEPRQILAIAKEVANGNFSRNIQLKAGDNQSLLHALKDMQQQLHERMEREKEMRQQLRERMEYEAKEKQSALRIRMALDKTSTNIMMADENHTIIYMNEALIELFREVQDEFRKELPQFDVNKLIGASIDLFHRRPAHQQANLEAMSTAIKSSFMIGGRNVDLIANPVIDDAGRRVGTVVEWKDRTHEIKIENEIKAIVDAVKSGELGRRLDTGDKTGFFQMLGANINDLTAVIENVFTDIASVMRGVAEGDLTRHITNNYEGVYDSCKNDINATVDTLRERIELEAKEKQSALRIRMALDKTSTNIMMADENHNIIYVNEALTGLFREAQNELRRELPQFDVNKLIGTSIELFHKKSANPESNLDTIRSTVKSSFVIGGRNIDFVANPVIDDTNHRVGTVVEWKDRTHEIKIENEIKAIVDAVKSGELGHRLDTADKTGFFQMLGANINDLTAVIENVFTDIANVMRSMAEGDLTRHITNNYEGVYGSCKNDINATIDKLRDVFIQIQDAADSISQSSDEIASGNNDLSNRAEQQAASLEETASSMEELTGTVKHNAEYAQQANHEATQARQLAEQGSHVAGSAVRAMMVINESNNKIGDIIGVIDEIALQTNILALNAAVEAARAGEQGRGFAVVASEVRNLAQRSATAAKEIKALIVDSVEKVEDGGKLVSDAGKSLNEIVAGVKQLNSIIAQIASESDQQFQGIKQINLTVAQMDDITQQNAALAEQAAAASVSMTDQAAHMRNLLAFFHLGGHSSPLNTSKQHALSSAHKTKVDAPTKQPLIAGQRNDEDQWEEF